MYYSRLRVVCDLAFSEILMAEIAEAGFDTFMENAEGFEAFAEQSDFNDQRVQLIKEKYSGVTPLDFFYDRVEKKNWNEEWEKNYEPIIVEDEVIVRADFHKPDKTFPYDIIITPKMSFGTGHHQTTYLMLKAQLRLDHRNKLVMDAGTGTGILSVMAAKRGAKKVEAFDIDDWSVENGNENIGLNKCLNVTIRKGKISELTFDENFDIVLANINKNILLEEMHFYAAYLNPKGNLLLSGFYDYDVQDIMTEAQRYGLQQADLLTRDGWACLRLTK